MRLKLTWQATALIHPIPVLERLTTTVEPLRCLRPVGRPSLASVANGH